MVDLTRLLKKIFLPVFDEQSVFIMGLSFVLLVIFDPTVAANFSIWAPGHKEGEGIITVIVLAGLLIMGMILASYHVIIKGPKSPEEKGVLLYFGILLNFLACFCAWGQLMKEAAGILWIFPVWNFFSAFSGFWIYWDEDSESYFLDQDTSYLQLLIGILVVIGLLYYCLQIQMLHWSITFSICVFYAGNVDDLLRSLVLKSSSSGRSGN